VPVQGYIIFGFLGLAIGSFLNVVAYRLPRGESLVRPGSHCPGCDRALKPYENIPLLSWLWLRGRCRSCGARISVRYPLIELATAVLYVTICMSLWGEWRRMVLGLVLTTFLIPISAIDLDVKRIPNALTAPAALLAVPIALVTEIGFVPEQLIAGLAAALFFFLPALINPRGMGMGDVKLAGVMGLYLGAPVAAAILIGMIAGTIVGISIMVRHGLSAGRKKALPFGPFLALGAIVCVYAGPELVNRYLSTFGLS